MLVKICKVGPESQQPLAHYAGHSAAFYYLREKYINYIHNLPSVAIQL